MESSVAESTDGDTLNTNQWSWTLLLDDGATKNRGQGGELVVCTASHAVTQSIQLYHAKTYLDNSLIQMRRITSC